MPLVSFFKAHPLAPLAAIAVQRAWFTKQLAAYHSLPTACRAARVVYQAAYCLSFPSDFIATYAHIPASLPMSFSVNVSALTSCVLGVCWPLVLFWCGRSACSVMSDDPHKKPSHQPRRHQHLHSSCESRSYPLSDGSDVATFTPVNQVSNSASSLLCLHMM